MCGDMSWMLLFFTLGLVAQTSVAEKYDPCPALSAEYSSSVTCDLAGVNVSCNEAPHKTKTRMLWKTSVIKFNKNVNRIVCRNGVWELATPNRTPPDYVNVGGGYYKLYINKTGCREAESMCQKDGAKLLVIDSKAEMNAIFQYIFMENSTIKQIYYGVFLNDEKQFFTVNGDRFPDNWIITWGGGEPSRQPNEECTFLSLDDFKAHDVTTTGFGAPFVCEFKNP